MQQRTCLVHVVRACCADDGCCAKLDRRSLATPIEHRATKQLEHILYVALWSRRPAGISYGLKICLQQTFAEQMPSLSG